MTYWNTFLNEIPLKKRLGAAFGGNGEEWAVVAGASEGIGRAYALELAKCGFNIKLVSRSQENLEKFAEEAKVLNPGIKT